MKNKILIALSLAGTLMLSACENFLDVDSPSIANQTYVFSTTTDAYKVLLGAYECFCEDAYSSRLSNVFMVNTDVEIAPVSQTQINANDRRGIWCYNPNASFSDIYNAWKNAYLAVDRCNQVITGIKSSALYAAGNADMKQMLGEAYTLRAYWYWELCNYWGDVPFYNDPSTTLNDSPKPRMDKNKIYSMCLQSMIDNESGMKWASDLSGGIERMNRDFCLGMISRMAMFRAGYGMTKGGTMQRADDYLDVASNDTLAVTYTNPSGVKTTARTYKEYFQLAKDYCVKLRSNRTYTMNTDFWQIFKNECEYSTPTNQDVMYEVGFVSNSGGDVGWCLGLSVVGGSYGAGTSYIQFSAPYVLSFDTNDQRYKATCSNIYYKNESTQNALKGNATVPAKWCRLWLKSSPGSSSSKGTGINWPLMRWSDVLLMEAEAENELNGPTSTAKSALTEVRARAYINATSDVQTSKVTNYVDSVAGSQDLFKKAIVNERAWEFGGEMLRKFDLVRWNLFGDKVLEMINKEYEMGKRSNLLDGNGTYTVNSSLTPSKDYADVLYFTFKNGIVNFLNDPHTYMSQADAMSKAGTSAFPIQIVETDIPTGYTSNTLYQIDWAKACFANTTVGKVTTYYPCDMIQWSFYGYTKETAVSSLNWQTMYNTSTRAPFPYLLPISTTTTGAASGVLDNNGWLLNN